MKKILYTVFAVLLAGGLWSCTPKEEVKEEKVVDLRYRVNDSYDLPAAGAPQITILVASTDPWTVTSAHPDWCIIDIEEGSGQDADAVHTGKADVTTVRVQYYNNTDLDDRTDQLIIATDTWVGKKVTVNQKGCAFLSVPEEDLAFDVVKAGGDYQIHISSNQPWSSKVTDGDWVSIADGASGEGDGTVTVTAAENVEELRYAAVTIYDRHGAAMATALFTQDGVQLVPGSTELRAGFDQTSSELEVVSNTKWTVTKASESDDWFTIDTPTGEGNGNIKLSLTPNTGTTMRRSSIILKNVVDNEGDYAVEKEITVKQAYEPFGSPTGPTPRSIPRTSERFSLRRPVSTGACLSAHIPSAGAPSAPVPACATGSASPTASSSRPTSVPPAPRSALTSTRLLQE